MKISRVAYEQYLRGPEWKAKRREALDAGKHRCQGCTATDALQVHHLTYERLGFERLTDLMVLCEQCHALEHGRAMRAGMPFAGPSVEDMTRQARTHDELRRLQAGQGRDLRSRSFVLGKKVQRERREQKGLPPLSGEACVSHTGPILSVLTMPDPPADAITPKVAHDPGSYTCPCDKCRAEVGRAVKRGVRGLRPLPVKRAA